MGMYVEPRLDWQWSSMRVQVPRDCMPWQQITAKQVLAYTIGALNVGFVRELEPLGRAKAEATAASWTAKSGGALHATVDLARALVSFEVNGKRLDESLNGSGWKIGSDGASVPRHLRFRTIQRPVEPAVGGLTAHRIGGYYRGETAKMLERGRRAEDQLLRAHDEYMKVMQRGQDMRNQQFREGQYAKRQITDDRVDFLLDCQRFPDGTTVGNCVNRETAPSRY